MITLVLPVIVAIVNVVAIKVYGPWRWFSGHTHNGYHHTNASWTRRSHGDKPVLHPTGNAIRWHHWPRWWRAGIRTGVTLGLYLFLIGEAAAPVLTLAVLAALAAGGLLLGGQWAHRKLRNWRLDRDYVQPFNMALPPDITVRKLAPDRSHAVLALSPGCVIDSKEQDKILQIAAAKLNVSGQLKGDFRSKVHGKNPTATITLVKPPPGYVGFADIRADADAAAEHEFVPGLTAPTGKTGRKGEPYLISVKNDCPHLGFSMTSGDGKSIASRCAACQFAHHGAIVAILDAKLMSHHWAAGLSNVAYAREPAEIHALALWLAKEVYQRNKYALLNADVEGKVHGSVGPRIVGILEEMNITQQVLAAYWKETGGKGKSPAVLALDYVSASGRQVDVNLAYIGQRLSAKATSAGSGDARENIGVFFTRNARKSTWDMLGLGDRHDLPSATDVVGRMQVATAKTVTEVQGAYVTGAEARAYATSGIVAVPPADMPCVGGLAPLGTPERAAMDAASQDVTDTPAIEAQRPDLRLVTDSPGHPPLQPTRITIPQAIEENISGPTHDAVRQALRRDRLAGKPVPEPVGRRGNADEYDRTEWCDWEEARRQPRRLTR